MIWRSTATVTVVSLAYALLAGCATPPPAIGMFEDSTEILYGEALLEYNNYTKMFVKAGDFNMRGSDTGLVCNGRIALGGTPLDNEQAPVGMTCKGQGGKVTAQCEDERLLEATWTANSCKAGSGSGSDSSGRAFAFTFGISERKAIDRIERMLGVHRNRPGWPRADHDK